MILARPFSGYIPIVKATPLEASDMGRQLQTPAFEISRREMVAGIALLAAMPVFPLAASAQDANNRSEGEVEMGSGYVTTDNGTQIFFKDRGAPSRSCSITAGRYRPTTGQPDAVLPRERLSRRRP